MREHVRNLKIIQLHVAQNWRRKAVNLGFVIITFRTRSENALLSNGGRRIMFVRLSEIHRKNAHSTTPRKKNKTQKQTEITTLATYGSPSNNFIDSLRKHVAVRIHGLAAYIVRFFHVRLPI